MYNQLLQKARQSSVELNLGKIERAWEFANLAHTGQMRLSGEPFINHPTTVALTLIGWRLDTDAVVAGLLHDTIEDGGATREDLVTQFGEPVALIVDGVTKITGIHLTGSRDQQYVENLRKMLLVMAKDLRVVLVKLADRLHNMQTLSALPPESQIANAQETLEIYAPLAERLGIGEIKGVLEDLSFPYVYPREAKALADLTKPLYAQGQRYINNFRRQLLSHLAAQIPTAVVNIRQKHLYSLFKKLQRPGIDGDITKIHDIVASRVIVDTTEQCYLALGIIHGLFHPVPYLGISDFIASPKPNGYRSIHTKVFGPKGRIVEIQIRTHQMHEEAEMGIAAHWHYAQAKAGGASDSALQKGQIQVSPKLGWVKQLVSWQQEFTSTEEYLQALKFDALQHRHLVFSPAGDVYDLPEGATPVDFAYAVHTDLGNRTVSAKVNGKLVPLDYRLQNGDVVEIAASKNPKKPSQKWLEFVVTADARHSISKSLRN